MRSANSPSWLTSHDKVATLHIFLSSSLCCSVPFLWPEAASFSSEPWLIIKWALYSMQKKVCVCALVRLFEALSSTANFKAPRGTYPCHPRHSQRDKKLCVWIRIYTEHKKGCSAVWIFFFHFIPTSNAYAFVREALFMIKFFFASLAAIFHLSRRRLPLLECSVCCRGNDAHIATTSWQWSSRGFTR